MADIFVFDKNADERCRLLTFTRSCISHRSDDSLEFFEYGKISDALGFINKGTPIDMAMLEVKEKQDILLSIRVRESQDGADIMLIADSSLSPMTYLNPKIRPSSLLLRPFDDKSAKQVIDDFIIDYYNRQNSDEKSLIVDNKDGKYAVPFSKIYFIEVREKRLYIRMQNKEIWQYGSLENILKLLPSQFIRCHRSFIFNSTHLSRVKLSENTIFLEHGIEVPLSRSFKGAIKEHLNELGM